MSELMKLQKKELARIIGGLELHIDDKDKTITQMAIDYANKDSQYAGVEEKLNDTKLRIANIERGHEKELINKENQITELKMQIKGDSKRFDGINSAIDTVAAIKFPALYIQSEPAPDDIIDEQFYMLRYFKRLVSPKNVTNFTIVDGNWGDE